MLMRWAVSLAAKKTGYSFLIHALASHFRHDAQRHFGAINRTAKPICSGRPARYYVIRDWFHFLLPNAPGQTCGPCAIEFMGGLNRLSVAAGWAQWFYFCG